MGYSLKIAARYLGAKSKGRFVSVGTAFAIIGVALGVAALLIVMSVTGGFQSEFRRKVLGVNAHVLVLKYSSDFREYRSVMKLMRDVPGIIGVAPFTINPMMVSHNEQAATGILVKGVDPELMPTVLDLPKHILPGGSLEGLRKPGAAPPERTYSTGGIVPVAPSIHEQGGPTVSTRISDAGVEYDDAGRNLTLLRAIEESIERERQQEAAKKKNTLGGTDDTDEESAPTLDDIIALERADAGTSDPLDAQASTPASDEDTPSDTEAIVGLVEPDGGYKSELPDPLDELPDEVAPDPCNSPEAIANLPGIVIGKTLAENLNVKVGDCMQVTSPTIGYSYSGGAIRPPVASQFKVIAIFEAGFDQYDSKLVYVDLYEAQRFQDFGDSVTGVEAKVDNIDNANAIEQQVRDKLESKLYSTMDWEDLNRGLFTALLIQKIGMSAVLALIIFVAAFTVVATLIMLVLEKKKEISVLKAMGATDTAILRIFVYQGGIIGLVGTAVGLGLGWGVCKGLLVYGFPLDPKVYFISRLPVEVRPIEFFVAGGISLTLCLIATVIPALYAARLRPADGVRPS